MAKPKTKAEARDLFDISAAAARRPAPREKAPARLSGAEAAYTARDIEVLEGLEPVPPIYMPGRRRTGSRPSSTSMSRAV